MLLQNSLQQATLIDEIKRFSVAHAALQGIKQTEIRTVHEKLGNSSNMTDSFRSALWIQRAQEFEEKNMPLEAFKRYNMARFPYLDSEIREKAYEGCKRTFMQWKHRQPRHNPIEKLQIAIGSKITVPVYLAHRETSEGPLLIIMGGIVSIKEQWHSFLQHAARMKNSVAVIDFPGTGENPLSYHADSHRDFCSLVDFLLNMTGKPACVAVAMSFAGTVFMKTALIDARIRGVFANASPICHFFCNAAWWARVPLLSKSALAASMQRPLSEVEQRKKELALTIGDLQRFDQPLTYVANLRDEIIPVHDFKMLGQHVRNLKLLKINDVHGAPNDMLRVKLELMWFLGRMTGRDKTMLGRLIALLRWLKKYI